MIDEDEKNNDDYDEGDKMFSLIQQSFEEAESKKKEEEEDEGKPDQLTQLVTTFSQKATTEHTGVLAEDPLYMAYAEIMGRFVCVSIVLPYPSICLSCI